MQTITVSTKSRTQFIDITASVQNAVNKMELDDGIVTVFVPHTTGAVTIQENCDPDVMDDIDKVLDRAVPWSAGYAHREGNTAAHVKASLMGASAQIIVESGRLLLGTWQGIYFCEFDGPRARKVWIKITGK